MSEKERFGGIVPRLLKPLLIIAGKVQPLSNSHAGWVGVGGLIAGGMFFANQPEAPEIIKRAANYFMIIGFLALAGRVIASPADREHGIFADDQNSLDPKE